MPVTDPSQMLPQPGATPARARILGSSVVVLVPAEEPQAIRRTAAIREVAIAGVAGLLIVLLQNRRRTVA
jgi:hypothetical protein